MGAGQGSAWVVMPTQGRLMHKVGLPQSHFVCAQWLIIIAQHDPATVALLDGRIGRQAVLK